METDPHGNPVPKYRTEVRTGWTAQNLYFLFVCPYEQLNLRPNPKTSSVPISRMSSGTKSLRFRHRENGQTWILISINRITRKVGPGIPASRFRHESTVLLAFGTAQ